MLDCFTAIFSCADLGLSGKGEPDIFRIALAHLGTERAETAVFEDALHAVRTAKADGFPVVGVYDPYEPEQETWPTAILSATNTARTFSPSQQTSESQRQTGGTTLCRYRKVNANPSKRSENR